MLLGDLPMTVNTYCLLCQEMVTIAGAVVHSGWYICPWCREPGVLVPLSDKTPSNVDAWAIEDPPVILELAIWRRA